jgi:steroid 5-alpha reductase family enzyme
VTGIVVTAVGELIRIWAVHHIGTISRTRSARLGPLIADGPFAFVRNPLYLGNIALWVGFALTARLVWLAPLAVLLLGAEYHAIVRWEEALLEARLGEVYRVYARRVPRWLPTLHHRGTEVGARTVPATSVPRGGGFSWPDTLFSERGTLVAMGAGYLLLWLKAHS